MNQTTLNIFPDIMVFDDICDEQLLDEVYKVHTESGENNTIYYPFIDKRRSMESDNKFYDSAMKLINHVWGDVLAHLLPEVHAGYEAWTNILGLGGGVGPHMDCDERIYDGMSEWVLPSWGSTIYAGPKGMGGIKEGGELHYNAGLRRLLIYTPSNFQKVIQSPDPMLDKPTVIPYRYNRVVVFKQAPHWVSPVKAMHNTDSPRVAVNCSVWDHTIEPMSRKEREGEDFDEFEI